MHLFSNLFCLLMLFLPMLWLAQDMLIKRGLLVRWVEHRVEKADPSKRDAVLTNWKVLGFLTLEQYYKLQDKFGLAAEKQPEGQRSPEQLAVITKDQQKRAEGMSVIAAMGPYKTRMVKLEHLYITIFKLANEVNYHREKAGMERLELEL